MSKFVIYCPHGSRAIGANYYTRSILKSLAKEKWLWLRMEVGPRGANLLAIKVKATSPGLSNRPDTFRGR